MISQSEAPAARPGEARSQYKNKPRGGLRMSYAAEVRYRGCLMVVYMFGLGDPDGRGGVNGGE